MHSWKRAALTLGASLLVTACIVVPAENRGPQNSQPMPPPPPPPPPAYAEPAPAYQQPATYPEATTVVYYEEPAPQPVTYYESNVTWYYGPHPVTPGYGAGWCPIRGGHTHNYEPYWNDRYEFYSGYYYYLGDPSQYEPSSAYYIYIGAHPNPWGGWCYAGSEHRHYYSPRRADPYRYDRGVFYYSGQYDQTYYGNRNQYDNNGHRNSGNAYVDHRQYRDTHSSATHENTGNNGHDNGRGNNGHDNGNAGRDTRELSTPPQGGSTRIIAPQPTPTPSGRQFQLIAPAATPTPAPDRGPRIVAPVATPTPEMGRLAPRPTPTPTPAIGRGLAPHPAATPTPAPVGPRGLNKAPTPTPTPTPRFRR